eukprot:CAMPEP_0178733866 /NCGR_PEP_ID=MMETSP0744-20121128/1027_1 /TAXON_ID=913974 /ORGANISM="Nitzschia punctata, Strain CCMP561" /LENGTH=153 /DNA_ID=CAMNT_0020386085 /DNA_START=277 /DNA_END=738 /DNA_ORIENTATION=-
MTTNGNWFWNNMNKLNQAHEQLKHAVHSYWRQNRYLAPKSTVGKVFMSCVYFSIPVVIGYYVSTKAVELSESTVEERFGNPGATAESPLKSSNKLTASQEGDDKILGVVGVQMVTSDRETQEINRVNLERFLKKQRKLKEKREREQMEKEADN